MLSTILLVTLIAIAQGTEGNDVNNITTPTETENENSKKFKETTTDKTNENVTTIEDNVGNSNSLNVKNVSLELFSLLNVQGDNKRISDLKTKISKINNYVVNRDQFDDILKNATSESNLNSTSFYDSLQKDDNFKFLNDKEPKHLYLKLKERMNRNDIIKIIAERGDRKKLVHYARRMMQEDLAYNSKNNEEVINAVVDKYLGEAPTDNHTLDYKKNESIYWDPQGELEDLQERRKDKVDGRRLFKGERTTIRHYPFMVSVHVAGRFWCGGVLYWHDLVLTSASCLQLMHNNRFFRENPRVLSVRVGSNHSRIGGEEVYAIEVYFHPAYNPKTLRNNLAMVRLHRHLFFSYHRIPKIIDISGYPHGMAPTAEVMLLGWGVTKISQKLSYEPIFLQRKYLPVYPNTFCKEVYGDKFITESMFCAGTLTTGEGACDHDAGGPAILGGKLVGIISFGPTICGFPNAPTVFTLVGAYSDWIKMVNDSMPSYYRGKKYTTTTTRHMVFSYLQTLLQLHTSTPHPPLVTSVVEETTTKPDNVLRQGLQYNDETFSPKQRIVPPVFKLTKKKKKTSRNKHKKAREYIEENDLEIEFK